MKNFKIFFILTSILSFYTFIFADYNSLKEAVNSGANNKEYSFKGNEVATESIGNLNGNQLTVFGNDYTILSNNKNNKGITIDNSNKTLNIENLTINGFCGPIRNSGNVNIKSTTFINNISDSSSNNAVIYNGKNLVLDDVIITSNSISTSYNSNNGIIYNSPNATTTIKNALFSLNNAGIQNKGNLIVEDNIIFYNNNNNNSSSSGIAACIANTSSTAIVTIGTNSQFNYNKSSSSGGAILNAGIFNISSKAQFNFNESSYSGGAIYNTNKATITVGPNSQFNCNTANNGGAIYNDYSNVIISSNAIFSSNVANTGYGGAICNYGSPYSGNNSIAVTTILDGAIFYNNISKKSYGGAIFNKEGILNLTAKTNNIEFTGNTANGISNAIYDYNGTINLCAFDNAYIIFNDRITSYSQNNNKSILNINMSATEKQFGTVILNEDMSGYFGQVNFYNGTIQLGKKGTLFGGNMYIDNGTIDMANNVIQNHNFNKLLIADKLNLVIDADLKNKKADTISASEDSNVIWEKINIKAINILADAKEKETEVLFTTSTILKDKITSTTTASSKLYKYNVVYNDGYFNFTNVGGNPETNPVIFESNIASVASGLITQTTVLNQAFSSIDNIKTKMAQAKQKGLLYASTADMLFENNNRIENGLWIRPFTVQDTISFDSLDVDNTLIGTLAGIDLALWKNSILSFYLGYAGSNQKYEDIKVSQTGYIIGATGMIIENNLYVGLTANINFNKAESQSTYGTDNFDMNMYSIGVKTGYNFNLSEKFVLEPNLTIMYGNISNQEYETTQGATIDSQSTTNITTTPQIKAKLSLINEWQPYGLIGYVTNISDKEKLVADKTDFETEKIDGYLEYGLGVNKEFINTPWSCYLQVTGRSGGRNGFGGNLGIKYSFGNN